MKTFWKVCGFIFGYLSPVVFLTVFMFTHFWKTGPAAPSQSEMFWLTFAAASYMGHRMWKEIEEWSA